MRKLGVVISSFVVHTLLLIGAVVLMIGPVTLTWKLIFPVTLLVVGSIAFVAFSQFPEWEVVLFELGVGGAVALIAIVVALLDWMGANDQDITFSNWGEFAYDLMTFYLTPRFIGLVLFLFVTILGTSYLGIRFARRREPSAFTM